MKKQEKTVKVEKPVDAGQLGSAVALLDSTHDYELSSACVSLYQLVEKSEEKKLELLHHENCIQKLIDLLDNECLSVRRMSCMVLACLSLNETIRKAIKKCKCSLNKLLCMLKCEDDDILKENILLLLSSMANEMSWKISIVDEGGLVILLDFLQSEDPDIAKNSLHTLALVLQYFGAKVAIYSCNNIHHIFGLMFSKHIIIKQLTIAVLIQAADYAPMQIVLGMRGVMEMILGCLLCSEDGSSLPHVLHLLSKCLNVPNMIQEFCSYCGIKSLLCLLNNQKEHEEEKKTIKKAVSSKNKKDKHNVDEVPVKEEFKFMQIQDMTDSIFECLQKIAIQPKFYRALQRENFDDLLISQLPALESSGKNQKTFFNLLGVLCSNIKSRLFFGERVDMLFKLISSHISSADPDTFRAISFFLTNLSFECQKNCKLLAVNSDLEQILPTLLKSPSEEVIAETCRLICNLSCCFESKLIISNDVINQLIHILKCQLPCPQRSKAKNEKSTDNLVTPFNKSCAIIEKICVVLAYLSIDQNTRTRILEGDVIKLIVSLLECEQPKILKASSLLVSILAEDPELAEIIYNLCGLPKLYEVQKSRSRKNEFSHHALHQLYKLKLVEKFTFLGYLSYDEEIKDGFYDVGKIDSDKSSYFCLKALNSYLYEDCDRWRPVFVVNAKLPKKMVDKPEDNQQTIDLRGSASNANKSNPVIREKQKKNVKRIEATAQVIATNDIIENESKIPDIPQDVELLSLIEKCQADIAGLPTTKHQVISLARLVSDSMGGMIMKDYINNFEWEGRMNDLQKISNLIPLGKIKYGIHFHRALLFKVLANSIDLRCKLNRGEYNRGFIEVILMEERKMLLPEYNKCVDQLVPERYIVDVLFQPGHLIPSDSEEAEIYTSL